MSSTTARLPPALIPANSIRALFSPYLWLATIHLTLDAVTAVFLGGLTVLMLLAIVFSFPFALVGLPVFALFAAVINALSRTELRRYAVTLGLQTESAPFPPRIGPARTDLRRLLGSRAIWRRLGYFVVMVPLGGVNLAGVLLAWSIPPTFALLPFYVHVDGGGRYLNLGALTPQVQSDARIYCAIAVVFLLLVSPQIIRVLASFDAFLARMLLGQSAEQALARRVGELERTLRQVVDAGDEERRRIERDLHDGAQQRLVSLAMTLGRARERLPEDVDAETVAMLDEAHSEAKQAITELRNLTRGLHPPVLTDRRLDAALSSVAARSPVPVTVHVAADPRPSATVEAIAYFVCTESVTNIAKHAQATRASITVDREGDLLRIQIIDDGVGGADPAHGSGLRGLADRVAGIDGTVRVLSPVGGPTTISVELPCR